MFKFFKISVIFLFFLGINFIHSQDKLLNVEYGFAHKPTPEMIKLAESNQMLYDAIQSANIGADFIKIKLFINNHEAIAFIDEVMNSDAVDIRTAIAASGHKEPIYSNLKTCDVLIPANENLFKKGMYHYDNNNLTYKWEITQERKEILGFVCYKAVTNIENHKTTNQIVAWFTPDIPFQFGPRGYGNLPGLILELEEGRTIFTAKRLDFNPKKISIYPPKGIRLSNKEYQDKSKDIIESMKKNFE